MTTTQQEQPTPGLDFLAGQVARMAAEIQDIKEGQLDLSRRVDQTREELNNRIDQARGEMSLRIDQTREELGRRIDDTNKKIDDTNKKIDRMTWGLFTITGAILAGLITYIIRSFSGLPPG